MPTTRNCIDLPQSSEGSLWNFDLVQIPLMIKKKCDIIHTLESVSSVRTNIYFPFRWQAQLFPHKYCYNFETSLYYLTVLHFKYLFVFYGNS